MRTETRTVFVVWLLLAATAACAQQGDQEEAYDLDEPQKAFAWIEVEERVKVGDTVRLQVTVLNLRKKARFVLQDVDISHTWLEGFEIVQVEPKPNAIVDFGPAYESLEFSRSISPGERLTVSVTLRATKAGVYSGDVDIWEEQNDEGYFTRRAQTHVIP